jgi:membrane protease subunit (stomatin/prohibitin family)
MAAIGDLGAYTQFKTAQAIGDAANNPGTAGDVTSAGVGLGAGVGIGQAMAGALRDATHQSPAKAASQSEATSGAADTMTCPNCQATVTASSRFCPNCGTTLQAVACPKCGHQNAPGAKFCSNCGNALAPS